MSGGGDNERTRSARMTCLFNAKHQRSDPCLEDSPHFKIIRTKDRGSFSVARSDLVRNQLIVQCSAASCVVDTPFSMKCCHGCFRTFAHHEWVQPACVDCTWFHLCEHCSLGSGSCYSGSMMMAMANDHLKIHRGCGECLLDSKWFSESALAKQCTLIRYALRTIYFLNTETAHPVRLHLPSTDDGTVFGSPTRKEWDRVCDHLGKERIDKKHPETHALYTNIADEVLAILRQSQKHSPTPSWIVMSSRQIHSTVVRSLWKLHLNEHGSVDRTEMAVIGRGLFPAGVLFNHSCRPNCWFTINSAKGGILEYRTLTDVAANEELTIAYAFMGLPVSIRRPYLFEKYNFACCCDRCVFATTNPYLSIATSGTEEETERVRRFISDRTYLIDLRRAREQDEVLRLHKTLFEMMDRALVAGCRGLSWTTDSKCRIREEDLYLFLNETLSFCFLLRKMECSEEASSLLVLYSSALYSYLSSQDCSDWVCRDTFRMVAQNWLSTASSSKHVGATELYQVIGTDGWGIAGTS
eukprot:ANDGO_04119.mRNA.1 hypothetical protein SAMD00019534_049040